MEEGTQSTWHFHMALEIPSGQNQALGMVPAQNDKTVDPVHLKSYLTKKKKRCYNVTVSTMIHPPFAKLPSVSYWPETDMSY